MAEALRLEWLQAIAEVKTLMNNVHSGAAISEWLMRSYIILGVCACMGCILAPKIPLKNTPSLSLPQMLTALRLTLYENLGI